MSTPFDGGPAFPVAYQSWDYDSQKYLPECDAGMSVRQYTAAKIMAGLCANPAIFQANERSGWDLVNCTEEQLCEMSWRLADLHIKAGA